MIFVRCKSSNSLVEGIFDEVIKNPTNYGAPKKDYRFVDETAAFGRVHIQLRTMCRITVCPYFSIQVCMGNNRCSPSDTIKSHRRVIKIQPPRVCRSMFVVKLYP